AEHQAVRGQVGPGHAVGHARVDAVERVGEAGAVGPALAALLLGDRLVRGVESQRLLLWAARSDVRDRVGDVVERGVPVYLVAAGREERVLLVRAGRGDVGGPDDPDAHALVAPGVQVAGVPQGHLR